MLIHIPEGCFSKLQHVKFLIRQEFRKNTELSYITHPDCLYLFMDNKNVLFLTADNVLDSSVQINKIEDEC